MFDIPSIRIGRLFGIPVEVNYSWFIIFALVTFSLSTAVFPEVEMAAGTSPLVFTIVSMVTALLFFGSIVAHELSHALVARAEGTDVGRITLFIFGGVAQIDEEPSSPGREFLMAAAGPGMSLLLAAVCTLGFTVTALWEYPWWVWAPLQYLAAINLMVGIFNLLPGFPLDGGRVLRSILWAVTGDLLKATRWASRSGQVIGWLMVTVAVLGVSNGNTDMIWFGLVGWFIASLAGQAYRQQEIRARTEGVSVASIMTPSPVYVSGDLVLEDLVHDHFIGGRHSRYPVLHDGAIVGVVSLSDVKRVDRAEWPHVRTIDVTDRDLAHLVVQGDTSVSTVLQRLAGERPGALIVVSDGRLAGIVTRADVISMLEHQVQS